MGLRTEGISTPFSPFLASEALLIVFHGKCSELDLQRHGDGNALDEVNAHRFLELIGETLTVMAMVIRFCC